MAHKFSVNETAAYYGYWASAASHPGRFELGPLNASFLLCNFYFYRLTNSSGNEQVESELGRLLLQIIGLIIIIIIINENRLVDSAHAPLSTQSSSHQNSGSEILSIRELVIYQNCVSADVY